MSCFVKLMSSAPHSSSSSPKSPPRTGPRVKVCPRPSLSIKLFSPRTKPVEPPSRSSSPPSVISSEGSGEDEYAKYSNTEFASPLDPAIHETGLGDVVIPKSIVTQKRRHSVKTTSSSDDDRDNDEDYVPKKQCAAPPPPSVDPPAPPKPTSKKVPWVEGFVGKQIIATRKPLSIDLLPDGVTLIVARWRYVLHSEDFVGYKYVLVDSLGGEWYAPQVFDKWREKANKHELPEVNPAYCRVGLYKNGKQIIITSWSKKQGFKQITKDCVPTSHPYFDPSDEEKK